MDENTQIESPTWIAAGCRRDGSVALVFHWLYFKHLEFLWWFTGYSLSTPPPLWYFTGHTLAIQSCSGASLAIV